MSLGITEIIVILIIVLVLFGGKRIPELAKGLGRAQYEYKKAKEMLENEVKKIDNNRKGAKTVKRTAKKTSAKTKNVVKSKKKATNKTQPAKKTKKTPIKK
jgi:sec-independent protein translocase protein TatA